MRRGVVLPSLVFAVVTSVMGACSRSAADPGSSGGPIPVVAAENFYGDIAEQIGGPHVAVTSILSDPNADPHLFEPGTAAGAAVASARLVIDNGLGYDAFMDKLLQSSPSSTRTVITVADVLGVTDASANPHLWYDLPKVPEIAAAIANGLGSVDPVDAAYFQSNLATFNASLKPLDHALAQIRSDDAGAPVAYTEPVPGYLLAAAGLDVKTPEDFALAIEEGNEPVPQAVAAMNALLTGSQVKVLLYNSQATSPITEHLLALAQQSGVPVVPVSETLPPGQSFQDWQLGQLQALSAALGG